MPVSTNVLPTCDAPESAEGAAGPSGVTPEANNPSTMARVLGSAMCDTTEAATMGPTPSIFSSCSGVAASNASSDPKCRARSLAVVSPI